MADTNLSFVGLGIPRYSARGVEQSLTPIDISAQLRRTINGALRNLVFGEQLLQYQSTISGSAQNAPMGLDDTWSGKALTVDCVTELACPEYATPGRVIVSQRQEGDFIFYRPRMVMRIQAVRIERDEWGGVQSWQLDLLEMFPYREIIQPSGVARVVSSMIGKLKSVMRGTANVQSRAFATMAARMSGSSLASASATAVIQAMLSGVATATATAIIDRTRRLIGSVSAVSRASGILSAYLSGGVASGADLRLGLNAYLSGVAAAAALLSGGAIAARLSGIGAASVDASGTLTVGTPIGDSPFVDDVPGNRSVNIPAYATITIEIWGGGGGSVGITPAGTGDGTGEGTRSTNQTDGGQSTCTLPSTTLTANGGGRSTGRTRDVSSTLGSVGAGGTASGGDTNTTGASGGTGAYAGGINPVTGGDGGSSPNGGATADGPTDMTEGGNMESGVAGNAPGGGAAGGAHRSNVASLMFRAYGGGGGGYSAITFNSGDPGAPSPGYLLAYTIGEGGAAGTNQGGAVPTTSFNGAAGAPGRIRITWS